MTFADEIVHSIQAVVVGDVEPGVLVEVLDTEPYAVLFKVFRSARVVRLLCAQEAVHESLLDVVTVLWTLTSAKPLSLIWTEISLEAAVAVKFTGMFDVIVGSVSEPFPSVVYYAHQKHHILGENRERETGLSRAVSWKRASIPVASVCFSSYSQGGERGEYLKA
jgi:hypothetical protein